LRKLFLRANEKELNENCPSLMMIIMMMMMMANVLLVLHLSTKGATAVHTLFEMRKLWTSACDAALILCHAMLENT
jgi:hypothetical protein